MRPQPASRQCPLTLTVQYSPHVCHDFSTGVCEVKVCVHIRNGASPSSHPTSFVFKMLPPAEGKSISDRITLMCIRLKIVCLLALYLRPRGEWEQRAISPCFEAEVFLGGTNPKMGRISCTRREHHCQPDRMFPLPWGLQSESLPVPCASSRWHETHHICIPKPISDHAVVKWESDRTRVSVGAR